MFCNVMRIARAVLWSKWFWRRTRGVISFPYFSYWVSVNNNELFLVIYWNAPVHHHFRKEVGIEEVSCVVKVFERTVYWYVLGYLLCLCIFVLRVSIGWSGCSDICGLLQIRGYPYWFEGILFCLNQLFVSAWHNPWLFHLLLKFVPLVSRVSRIISIPDYVVQLLNNWMQILISVHQLNLEIIFFHGLWVGFFLILEVWDFFILISVVYL